MTEKAFLEKLQKTPNEISFQEVITVIDANYDFTPTTFVNGKTRNPAGQNSGSCKLFAFASFHDFSVEETLACFGDFYRIDVLQNPENTDHQNIRNFIEFGWKGIIFDDLALSPK